MMDLSIFTSVWRNHPKQKWINLVLAMQMSFNLMDNLKLRLIIITGGSDAFKYTDINLSSSQIKKLNQLNPRVHERFKESYNLNQTTSKYQDKINYTIRKVKLEDFTFDYPSKYQYGLQVEQFRANQLITIFNGKCTNTNWTEVKKKVKRSKRDSRKLETLPSN
uniref:Uncharacterized protein n=1 Tax=Tetranychus urticae TaxID=32264 RepID=T1JTN2_TETUR